MSKSEAGWFIYNNNNNLQLGYHPVATVADLYLADRSFLDFSFTCSISPVCLGKVI